MMKPIIGALTLAAAVFAAPAAWAQEVKPAVTAPAGSPVARHGALAVTDGQIVDADGTPVPLRGMSLFWSQWAPQYYDAATVGWLARDWKVDVVRAAIAAEGDDGARQHFEREFVKASTVIDAAVANGIYVIVDWHAHRAYPAEAERFLTAVARKYGHLPNLIYEDWNEPLRDGVEWSRDVKPYHERVLGAMRRIPRHEFVPPELTTRNSSVAAICGRGANMAPKVEAATSNRPSSKGRSSASASSHSMSRPSAADRCWPNSTIRGVRSEATTRAPRRAAARARFPVPAATSSTSIPGSTPQASTSATAAGSNGRASSR